MSTLLRHPSMGPKSAVRVWARGAKHSLARNSRPFVAQFARERENADGSSRTLVKGIDMESEELAAIVHGHFEEMAAQIECRACSTCCREIQPNLNEPDVTRLCSIVVTHATRSPPDS